MTTAGETVGHGTYVSVGADADVDVVFANAVAAGAPGVWEPGATDWGSYRCRVLDLGGYEWTFGTLRPGESSGDWPEES